MTKPTYTLKLHTWKHAVLITYKWTNAFYRESTHYIEIAADLDSAYVQPFKYRLTYRVLTNPQDPLARWVDRNYAIRDTDEDAVNEAEKQLEKLINRTMPAEIKRGKNRKPYKALAREIEDNPDLLKHYKPDFTHHDALNLGRYHPRRFVWILREAGTHLILSDGNYAREVIRYHARNKNAKYYTWNSRGLRQVTPNQALDFVKQYLTEEIPEPEYTI